MVAPPTYDNLASEVSDALALHYRKWVAEHDCDKIYAYVIYAAPLVAGFGISVLTEQGLKQVASDYKTKYGYEETLEQLAIDLRWSVADSILVSALNQFRHDTLGGAARPMLYVDF